MRFQRSRSAGGRRSGRGHSATFCWRVHARVSSAIGTSRRARGCTACGNRGMPFTACPTHATAGRSQHRARTRAFGYTRRRPSRRSSCSRVARSGARSCPVTCSRFFACVSTTATHSCSPPAAGIKSCISGTCALANRSAPSRAPSWQVCLFDLRRPGSAPATALTIEPAPGRRDDNDPYTVYACKFSRDPQRKLIGIGCGTAGSGNGVLKVYDRAARQFVESIELKGRSVYSLDFAPPSLPATSLAFTAGSKAGSFVQVLEVSPSQ
mmetsp:Transcript_33373/g.78396  ORF Transcript_33373/g.78396 Transcript_33373/m.78396 type:complete len:267 (-) Transcript_33373:69-869(-)